MSDVYQGCTYKGRKPTHADPVCITCRNGHHDKCLHSAPHTVRGFFGLHYGPPCDCDKQTGKGKTKDDVQRR